MPAAQPEVILDAGACDGVVFDMDGVLTDTATVHARAWKRMFDGYLRRRAERSGGDFEPFDVGSDYPEYVDGRPRYDGVRSFLESRGIELPEGAPDDPPDRETVCGLGNRKNDLFLQQIRDEGVDRFEDAVDLVAALRERGIRTAVISASKNAREVLEGAGLPCLFAVRIDGLVAQERRLEGKPAPDVFLEAARRLGVEPARAAVVEDALAGVRAGRAGGFRWVIGVARSGSGDALREAGATAVVQRLSEIAVRGQAATGRAGSGGEGRPIEALPSALDRLDAIARRCREGELVVFLDYDGTLAPIAERPADAVLPPETRRLLAGLAARRRVAIVSGRDLDDLRGLVGLDDVYYAGSHGFRLAGPGGWSRELADARKCLPELDRAEERLRGELAELPGVEIERKRYAVAVHVRRAPEEAVPEVRRALEAVCDGQSGLRIEKGRKVFELRPALPWGKGRALEWILEAMGAGTSPVVPVYIGDDVTDEDAFGAVEGRGVGVVVRGRTGRSRASYALDDPPAVRRFLAALDQRLRGARSGE